MYNIVSIGIPSSTPVHHSTVRSPTLGKCGHIRILCGRDCVLLSSAVPSNVLMVIRTCTDWFHLGACLGLEYHTLTTIKDTHVGHPEDCKVAMVSKWLQGMDGVSEAGGPSWQQLADVLRKLGHAREAQQIKKDYC